MLALLGPNGAGKTTTMRLLNGVLLPDGGRARVLGLDPWTQGEELRRRTGVLTENAGLDERFTALENLEFVGRLRGMSEAEARRRGGELLERFDMGHRADVKVQGFSTGQRKRVALARALLHDPELLFLDEPTSGLDPAATRDVVDLIGSLAADRGRTVVLCTHFLGEAGRLAVADGRAVPRRAPRVRHPRRAGRRAVVQPSRCASTSAAPATPELLAAGSSALPSRPARPPSTDAGALVLVDARATTCPPWSPPASPPGPPCSASTRGTRTSRTCTSPSRPRPPPLVPCSPPPLAAVRPARRCAS